MAKNSMLMLETNDATISTATITIRALNVGKKQMTQSVFRQLPEAVLVDEEKITLTGIPWGWINYRWGDIGEDYTNFVFQVGTRLFRCAFRIRDCKTERGGPSTRAVCLLAEHADSLREERAYLQVLAGSTRDDFRWWHDRVTVIVPDDVFGSGSFDPDQKMKNVLVEAATPDRLREDRARTATRIASRKYEDVYSQQGYLIQSAEHMRIGDQDELDRLNRMIAESPVRLAAAMDEFRAMVREKFEGSGNLPTIGEVDRRIEGAEARIRDYRRRWDDLMEQLRGVEQLFIAV
jgi:hypothetical protein